MVLENLDFSYNGKLSTDYGIINVKTSSGLFQEQFVADKSIDEHKVSGRTKPYFQGVERQPLQTNLTLYFENGFTSDDLNNVKQWLDLDTYEEFYFLNRPDRRYFLMMTSSSELMHNGAGQGYINVTVRANDAYAYSEEYLDNVIDLSNNPVSGSTISFENKGNVDLKPEIWISMVGSGNVSITNNSNNGDVFEFTGLSDNETVYVDNYDGDIVSSIPDVYRFNNFNDIYLDFVPGYNYLQISGNVKLQFRYRYLYK